LQHQTQGRYPAVFSGAIEIKTDLLKHAAENLNGRRRLGHDGAVPTWMRVRPRATVTSMDAPYTMEVTLHQTAREAHIGHGSQVL
jgi:hypothetical protein